MSINLITNYKMNTWFNLNCKYYDKNYNGNWVDRQVKICLKKNQLCGSYCKSKVCCAFYKWKWDKTIE